MSHPAAVPWLAHLRTDARGLPVPYVNRWGPEDVERVRVAHDPWVGGPGMFCDDTGQSVPDFTAQNMGRQREVMLRGLCQVCARPVPWSRRRLVLSGVSVETVDVPQLGRVPVVFEPWLDERCATLAVAYCPALIRRTRADDLRVHAVTSARSVRFVTSTGWAEGPLEEATKAQPAAMWVKLALLDVRLEQR